MQPDPIDPTEKTTPEQPSTTPADTPEATAQPSTNQTTTPDDGMVVSKPFTSETSIPGKSDAKRKIPAALLVVGLVVLLLGGGVAAYFSTVVANKPENVWARAMKNTNEGYSKLVEYAKDNKDNKGFKLDGSFKADVSSVVVDGTIKGKVYDKDAEMTLDIGAAGSRVTFDVLSHVPDNSTYPDVYLKANGLQGFGQMLGGSTTEAGSFLTAFDNQWFAIDHTLFETLEKQAGEQNAAASNLTPEDIYAIMEAIGRANEEYLFTDDESKAALQVKESVGKETLDGRSVYHYKVGYNKDNLKKYATALKDELNKTKVKELVPEKNLEKALNFDELLKEIDTLDGKSTADAWVDLDTKLIRKIRITEQDKPENYFDFIFNYNGGDDYPFLIAFHEKEGSTETNVSLGATLNTKQDTVDYKVDMKITGKNPVTANFNLKLTPSEEKIEFKKPEGAKSLSDLLGGLFGGQLPGTSNPGSLQSIDQLQL